MTIPGSPVAREVARRLLERETAGVGEPTGLGAAMQRAFARVAENLRRSIGDNGYDEVLERALAREPTTVHLNIDASVERHGTAPVRAALEALLAAIADILSDLVGEHMAHGLLDGDDRGA